MRTLNEQKIEIEQFGCARGARRVVVRDPGRRDRYEPGPRSVYRNGHRRAFGRRSDESPGDRKGRRSAGGRTLQGTDRGESEDRGRHQVRQAAGGGQSDRPGQKKESQREPWPVARDRARTGRQNVKAAVRDVRWAGCFSATVSRRGGKPVSGGRGGFSDSRSIERLGQCGTGVMANHHAHHRFWPRQPLRCGHEGCDPVDQRRAHCWSTLPTGLRRRIFARQPWSWPTRPPGFRRRRFTWRWLIPAWAPRKIVYARMGGQQFVAPDNGLLSRLALSASPSTIITIPHQPSFGCRGYRRPFMAVTSWPRWRLSSAGGSSPGRLGPVPA